MTNAATGVVRRARSLLSVLLAVALVTPIWPASAMTEPVPELADLVRARSVVALELARSDEAEADRRSAARSVVAAELEHREATTAFTVVTASLRAAERALDKHRDRFDVAERDFNDQIANSYKHVGGSSAAIYLAALQSARDAHDAARLLREVDSILGHGFEQLERRRVQLAEMDRRVTELRTERTAAIARLQAALEERRAARSTLDDARQAAAARERGVLNAAGVALAAEAAAVAAGATDEELAQVDDVLAGTEPTRDPLARSAASATPPDEETPSVEQRREWLDRRLGVLGEEVALSRDAWLPRTELVCPVRGGTFDDDFHNPRSHGRRHLGIDILADRGTPVRAMGPGVVDSVDTADGFDGDHDLGGVAVSYLTGDVRLYAAHLDRVADGLAAGDEVMAGQIIGYVGDTGNAVGGPPHLHLGMFIDGVAINPYLTVGVVCD